MLLGWPLDRCDFVTKANHILENNDFTKNQIDADYDSKWDIS